MNIIHRSFDCVIVENHALSNIHYKTTNVLKCLFSAINLNYVNKHIFRQQFTLANHLAKLYIPGGQNHAPQGDISPRTNSVITSSKNSVYIYGIDFEFYFLHTIKCHSLHPSVFLECLYLTTM